MNEFRNSEITAEEELIDVLSAISEVSKRLAEKLIVLSQTSQSKERVQKYGQNERNGCHYKRVKRNCVFY